MAEPITVNATWEPEVSYDGYTLVVGRWPIGSAFRESFEDDYNASLMFEHIGQGASLAEARQILVGAFRAWMEEVTGQTVRVIAKPRRGVIRILDQAIDQDEVDG